MSAVSATRLSLVASLATLALFTVTVPSGSSSPGFSDIDYCQGIYYPGTECWSGVYNYHYRNQMFHNNNPNGLPVGIMSNLTIGSWIYVYDGNGYVELSTQATYSQPACRSRTGSYVLYAKCTRRIGSGC